MGLWFELLEVKFEDVLDKVLNLTFVFQLPGVDNILLLKVGDDWSQGTYTL